MSNLSDFFGGISGGGVDSKEANSTLYLVGGGGGGSFENYPGAAGGELFKGCIRLESGCTYTVTIGAGGAGGGTNPACAGTPDGAGSPGGTTSFGKHRAYGGAGSATLFADTPVPCGGAGLGDLCLATVASGGLGGLGSGVPRQNATLNPSVFADPVQNPAATWCYTCNGDIYSESRHLQYNRSGAVVGAVGFRFNTRYDTPANPAFTAHFGAHDNIFSKRKIVNITEDPAWTPTSNSNSVCAESEFDFGLKVGGAPYCNAFCAYNAECFPATTPFANTNYVFGCSRANYFDAWGAPITSTGISSNSIQPMATNMGTGGLLRGQNGDSGIAIVVYNCDLGAATIGPTPTNALDCTPVTGPQGYRSYVFEGPGTFTLP